MGLIAIVVPLLFLGGCAAQKVVSAPEPLLCTDTEATNDAAVKSERIGPLIRSRRLLANGLLYDTLQTAPGYRLVQHPKRLLEALFAPTFLSPLVTCKNITLYRLATADNAYGLLLYRPGGRRVELVYPLDEATTSRRLQSLKKGQCPLHAEFPAFNAKTAATLMRWDVDLLLKNVAVPVRKTRFCPKR